MKLPPPDDEEEEELSDGDGLLEEDEELLLDDGLRVGEELLELRECQMIVQCPPSYVHTAIWRDSPYRLDEDSDLYSPTFTMKGPCSVLAVNGHIYLSPFFVGSGLLR